MHPTAGLSDAANAAGVDVAAYSEIENGTRAASDDVIYASVMPLSVLNACCGLIPLGWQKTITK